MDKAQARSVFDANKHPENRRGYNSDGNRYYYWGDDPMRYKEFAEAYIVLYDESQGNELFIRTKDGTGFRGYFRVSKEGLVTNWCTIPWTRIEFMEYH